MYMNHRWVLGLAAVALFLCSPAWADTTLHIGTGVGTTCQSGCAGHPNLISGESFDIAQVSNGTNAPISSLYLVLAVPNDTSALGITINGSTGAFVGFDNTTDIYNYLGTFQGANTLGVLGDNLVNLEGADSSILGITATGYGIYTFSVGSISPGGFVSIAGGGIPLGTFAFGLGIESNGNTAGTAITEAGLNVPEPSSLALLGAGLLSLFGIGRRRLENS